MLAPEWRLMERIHGECHAEMAFACHSSSVPEEFLAALVANESGGDPDAARFEPAVYRHLVAVVLGRRPAYGSITARKLQAELNPLPLPKSEEFHAQFLNTPFAAQHGAKLADFPDESLRELATSWGYTQIMGYHMVERHGTVHDLLEPAFHFRVALELLAEFCQRFALDPRREFAEMFRCWNTGQPDGKTFDPHYVERGLLRMKAYQELQD